MRPRCELLDRAAVEQALAQALQLLQRPGIQIGGDRVASLLSSSGVPIDRGVARIREAVALDALQTAPRSFPLYDRSGRAVVQYGGDAVHFAPGSSCAKILDFGATGPRETQARDLVNLVRLVEMLPQYAAQATAVVCNDVPAEIGDMYRLLLALRNSDKPVVTGAFTAETLAAMIEMLIIDAGSAEGLRARPRAVFDVCPASPLNWSEFGAENLIDLAQAGVPAEIVPAPLAGVTSPVTLIGTIVQHAAECISGVVIHQLASPGAPVVWGGAPAIFDMRTGATPWGAIESAMLAVGCAQIGRHVGLPVHAYLLTSDAKFVDTQAALESGISAVLGAMAGIHMISGAGMIASLSCQSLEKIVMDAEIIAMTHRLLDGIGLRPDLPAQSMILEAVERGSFLKLEATRRHFREEQYLPSDVIDREASQSGSPAQDAASRAHARVAELSSAYRAPTISPEVAGAWAEIVNAKAAIPEMR